MKVLYATILTIAAIPPILSVAVGIALGFLLGAIIADLYGLSILEDNSQ